MLIYSDKITDAERTSLQVLSNLLTKVATHPLTTKTARAAKTLAELPTCTTFETAALDQLGEEMEIAWQNMMGSEQQATVSQFYAAGEIRYAMRGAGMKAPQSFRDNVADALRAVNKAA